MRERLITLQRQADPLKSNKQDYPDVEFDVPVYVKSFSIAMAIDGSIVPKRSSSNKLTPDMKALFAKASKGNVIYFEEIVVRMPDGEDRIIGGLKIKIQ